MGDLTFDEWVPPTDVVLREAPVAQQPSQSRDPPLYTSIAVDNTVREYTKAVPSPRAPLPSGRREGRIWVLMAQQLELGRTAMGRHGHMGTLHLRVSPFRRVPSCDLLPREEVLHVKRE